jgi:hypothetical protein
MVDQGARATAGITERFVRRPLPGYFAIAMHNDARPAYYMTANGAGGDATDAIHTDATAVNDWEKFRLINGGVEDPNFSIMTLNGHFLTAVGGGGRTSNAIITTETWAQEWENFKLIPQAGTGFSPHFALQTSGGYFVTALGHGGQNTGDIVHTDAQVAKDWEMFDLLKIGDPGTHLTYSFEGLNSSGTSLFLNATDGGRHSDSASLTLQPGPGYMLAFTPIRQDDGAYALQTSSGYYVTAIGGGLPGVGYRTDTPEVNNWEKFRLIPNEVDCTTHIQTHTGTYISILGRRRRDSPLVIDNVADASRATRWRLWVMAFHA